MARVEMAHVVDLECGEHRRHSSGGATTVEPEEEEEGSFCFSDADEGSCYSQFYSTVDGSTYDDCSYACGSESEIAETTVDSRRASSAAAESDCSVDLEKGVGETKVHLRKIEKDCRICHLSFESSAPETEVSIELGCSCKGDLASAHKHCAETWFKIKGNKICEICNSVACNIVGPNETEPEQQVNEMNGVGANAASSTSEARSCWSGQKFLNFLLACMVFVFVISWLFHFNAPS